MVFVNPMQKSRRSRNPSWHHRLSKEERRRSVEENFEEAEAQAHRAYKPTTIPSDITSLFTDSHIQSTLSTPSKDDKRTSSTWTRSSGS
jgi:hypothetical protein